jgi:transcriptional regulator with XRE-family HTH domain
MEVLHMVAKNSAVGSKIKDYRQKLNLTQEQLAELLQNRYGLSTDRPTISKWETGFQEPTITPLKYLAEIFGTTIDRLNGSEDVPILTAPPMLNDNQKWLMDKIVKADPKQADKLRRMMELIDGEDQFS